MRLNARIVIATVLLLYSIKGLSQFVPLNDIVMRKTGERLLAYHVNDDKPFTGTVSESLDSITIKQTYKNGVLHGSKEIFKSGVKIEELYFVNNKKEGLFFQYYDNGSLKIKGQFSNDMKIGLWQMYYSNGKVKSSGNYVDDNEENRWKYYDDKGLLNRVDYYAKGVFLKSSIYQKGEKQDSAISILEMQVKFVNGEKHYYMSGSESFFSGLAFEILVDTLGNRSRLEFQIQKGKPSGRWTIFYDNYDSKHQIKATGFYDENGLVSGKYLEYYESGKTKCEGEYRNGLKNGSWIFYSEEGFPTLIGIMLDDAKHSVWRYFDEKGRVVKEELYIFGVKQD